MAIKIFSLFSLLPVLYVLNKIRKRRDFSCADILLFFETLYVAFVPLIGNEELIKYRVVRENYSVQLDLFLIYNLFAWLLVIIDIVFFHNSNNKNTLLNVTGYIRTWVKRNILPNKILVFLIILSILQWGINMSSYTRDVEMGLGSLDQRRDNIAETNTPFSLWLNSGLHFIRLYVVFMTSVYFFQKKVLGKKIEKKWLFGILVISEAFLHLQISRIYVLESVVLVLLIYYSLFKAQITFKSIFKGVVSLVLVVLLVFPLITGFRSARYAMIGGHLNSDNIVEVVGTGIRMMMDGDIDMEDADNKDTRMWDMYEALCLGCRSDYQGYGELTANAISVGIPSIIYPDKSKTGSQGIIEVETGANTDIADSMLLLGIMEFKFLSPILCVMYYGIFIISLMLIHRFIKNTFYNSNAIIIIFICVFMWLNRIEMTFDSLIATIINMLIWYSILLISLGVFNIKNKYIYAQ
jgi:hypothetical protein